MINTYWSSSFYPSLQIAGPVPSFKNDTFAPISDHALVLATANRTTHTEIIGCNDGWLAALLFGSSLMLAAAVAAAALRLVTPGPDILGYVGSMLRNSLHDTPVGGGSALDGPEFALAAGEVRVHLADVRGRDEVGYVALTTEDGRPLDWGRRYK